MSSIAVLPLAFFCVTAGAQQQPTHVTVAPDSARIVTADIDRFWRVLDSTPTGDLMATLQADYLDRATPGLRDYVPYRIFSALDLAHDIFTQRPRYDSVRAATRHARDAEPAIRLSFHKLDSLYSQAVFPDVYFIIGRFMTGGVRLASGIVVAAEIYDSPRKLPGIVAHELVHVQQSPPNNNETLLARAVREGSADFIGELISGVNINPAAQQYGRAHEHALWSEFRRVMHGKTYTPWMYTPRNDGRPNDLGYFIGYRIAQSYYERASDKREAIRDIILAKDADELLRRSRYDP